jgi:hypothetical protein
VCKIAKCLVALVLLGTGALAFGGTAASAAAPEIEGVWATKVTALSAWLHARIDPGGVSTTYHFEYIAEAAYETNLSEGKEAFAGAARAPAGAEAEAKPGASLVDVQIEGLIPETAYRYRAFVKNATPGSMFSAERIFTTRGFGAPLQLLDGRGWEMVSPVDKNGGAIQGFGGISGGGVLQAAAGGDAVTFSSASSFGQGGQGAPTASQYISRRTPSGWSTLNITQPLFSGAYGEDPDGVPYQLFSTDLARGLLAAPPYPPLAGTGAPAGYRNYYLRDNLGGGFEALVTSADVAALAIPPQKFELGFAGASPDLGHVVLSTCAALSPEATEVPGAGESCDAGSPNLYEWSPGAGLELVNLLPGESVGTPGARLAAPGGAISADGSRAYWTDGANLYLRADGAVTIQVDQAVGGGGVFQTATTDGSAAFFTKAGHLYRHDVATDAVTDLTPAGGVQGVLGSSSDGAYVYYLTAGGLFLARNGANLPVAAAADTSNVPPSTGTARVSLDGARLAFVSSAELTGYDNVDQTSGEPDSEVYLYDPALDTLTCVSCNPTGARPSGPSSIPGAVVNGLGEGATRAHKPRALTAGGGRLFFDTSDGLVLQDTNEDRDVYEWEAQGVGGCLKPDGCVQLISSGRAAAGASFVDASADGADVFFLTDRSLVPSDPGSVDLYDAREGGGFPEPSSPIPCEGDSCQSLPSPPDDPSPGTLVPSTGNAAPHFRKPGRKKPKHKKRQHRRRHRR